MSKVRVLVVDDSATMRGLVGAVLRRDLGHVDARGGPQPERLRDQKRAKHELGVRREHLDLDAVAENASEPEHRLEPGDSRAGDHHPGHAVLHRLDHPRHTRVRIRRNLRSGSVETRRQISGHC